jgi:hypothetical protein
MTITCITCTRDRPICMKLCERWMRAQTRQPDQWIVVDDGNPIDPPAGCTYIQRAHVVGEPTHTLGLNLLAAIPHVTGDLILPWEDDDYLGPNYIARMEEELQTAMIVGTRRCLKYAPRWRLWWQNTNEKHSSLMSTGIRRELLPSLEEAAKHNNPFIDIRLWERHLYQGRLITPLVPNWPVSVGMKGMPGYTSTATMNGRISQGVQKPRGTPDPELRKLREWIGSDAEAYAEFKA